MQIRLSDLRQRISQFKLDDSLVELNRMLHADRSDKLIGGRQSQMDLAETVLPHIAHFLAKEILIQCNNFGTHVLDREQFFELQHAIINLPDPIEIIPNWKESDPTGAIERMLQSQIPQQEYRPQQKIGLALGLFRDLGEIPKPFAFDIRNDVETEIGMTIDNFILMGFLIHAVSGAPGPKGSCPGSFTPMILAKAYADGISFCIPENWQPFLERVKCTVDQFRQELLPDTAEHYLPFEFNPLKKLPVIDIGQQRFVAPDPYLLIERVTKGIYFDLFTKSRTQFSQKFGYAFDRFVFQLLCSCIDKSRLWCESLLFELYGSHWHPPSQNADQAFVGDDVTVLIECKGMRPSTTLSTYGDDGSVKDIVSRLTDAVRQLTVHAISINKGDWCNYGLAPTSVVGIVATYGKLYTANLVFVRKRIEAQLNAENLTPIPWVVLSLEEIDMALSLVDRGVDFDDLVLTLIRTFNEHDGLFYSYKEMLRENAVSRFSRDKASALLDIITQCRPANFLPNARSLGTYFRHNYVFVGDHFCPICRRKN